MQDAQPGDGRPVRLSGGCGDPGARRFVSAAVRRHPASRAGGTAITGVTPEQGAIRLTSAQLLEIQRVGADRIVQVDGKPGLFTPLVGVDPADAPSTANLEKIVDILRQRVAELQTENAALTAKLTAAAAAGTSPEDFAAGIRHSLDTMQEQLAAMSNTMSDFAVREFSLESKVHVDVTPLGTIGFRFVQPGEEVNAAALSTLSITLVPLPKASAQASELGAGTPQDLGIDSIDGLSADQAARLRSAHVTTVSAFRRVATRATATAEMVSLLGVDRDTLGRYTLLAGLLTVPGLDRFKAAVLYDAGITDIQALAAISDPSDLVRRFAEAASKRADDNGFRPRPQDAAAWIDMAGRMVTQANPE